MKSKISAKTIFLPIILTLFCCSCQPEDDDSAKNYTVTFQTDHADKPNELSVTENYVLTGNDLKDLIAADYTFLGWYDGDKKAEAGNYAVTKDVTLTAKWEKNQFAITYYDGSNVLELLPNGFISEKSVAVLPFYGKAGYIFCGWFKEDDLSGNAVTEIAEGTSENVALYAKWQEAGLIGTASDKKQGEEFSPDIAIDGKTYGKTSEIVVIPNGTDAYINGSERSFVFINGRAVKLSPFAIGKYEVTQGLYSAVTGSNPSKFKSDEQPVEQVNWYRAIYFCNELTKKTMAESDCVYYNDNDAVYTSDDANNKKTPVLKLSNKGYRLPTEAEWEFAARGAKPADESFYNDNKNPDDYAWHSGNSGDTTHNVGTKNADYLNLHDMLGNVWEWCWDLYSDAGVTNEKIGSGKIEENPTGFVPGFYRVIRGGSWLNPGNMCNSSYRYRFNMDYNEAPTIGFRIARSI